MTCILKTQNEGFSVKCSTLCPGNAESENFLLRNVPSSKYMPPTKTSNMYPKTSLKKSNYGKKAYPLKLLSHEKEKSSFGMTKHSVDSQARQYRSLDILNKSSLIKNLSPSPRPAPTEKINKFSWRNKVVESIIIPRSQAFGKESITTTTFQTNKNSPKSKSNYDQRFRENGWNMNKEKDAKDSIMLKLAIKEVLSEGEEEIKAQEEYSSAYRSPYFSGFHKKIDAPSQQVQNLTFNNLR